MLFLLPIIQFDLIVVTVVYTADISSSHRSSHFSPSGVHRGTRHVSRFSLCQRVLWNSYRGFNIVFILNFNFHYRLLRTNQTWPINYVCLLRIFFSNLPRAIYFSALRLFLTYLQPPCLMFRLENSRNKILRIWYIIIQFSTYVGKLIINLHGFVLGCYKINTIFARSNQSSSHYQHR